MNILIVSSLLFLMPARGEDLVRCSGDSVMAQGRVSVTLSAAPNGKMLSLRKDDGTRSDMPVLAESAMALPDLAAFFACDSGKEDCLKKHFPEMASDSMDICVPSLLGLANVYRREGMPQTFSFDISKPRSGRFYHGYKPTKFGCWGLAEYFDESGRLLGRMFNMIEVFDCR